MQCTEVSVKDPCFATYACQCDNGYYSITSLMPDLSSAEAEDLGIEELVEENKESASEDDDEIFLGLVLWQVIVYGVGTLILLALITWIIVILCKKCKARKAKVGQGKIGGAKSATVEMKKKSNKKSKKGEDKERERRISIGDDMRITMENRLQE